MESLPNSRKLNGISLVECLQDEVTVDKENQQFSALVRSPRIVDQTFVKRYNNTSSSSKKRYLNNNYNNNNPVSKSLKSFFKKLRGTPTQSAAAAANNSSRATNTTNHAIVMLNNNQSLSSSSTPSITVPSRSLYSKYNNHNVKDHQKTVINNSRSSIAARPKKKKMMITKSTKNYHLPTIVTTNDHFRRYSSHHNNNNNNHRHTLDLSYATTSSFMNNQSEDEDSGVIYTNNSSKRRTNSLNNHSSIYSTFTTTTTSKKSPSASILTSSTSSSSITSFLSSASASSACMKRSNNTVKNITELLVVNDDDENIQLQKRLWNEDATLCSKEEIAPWLGSKPSLRSRVLFLYMNNFDFSNQRLDEAFRTLCSKLYLKGESQQLDRIIEAFAKRYYVCNPTTLLHCVDVVYAVAYSLLLLNTDLHVVSDWANKMTRNSFVKNTMETVQSLVFPHLVINDGGDNTGNFIKQRKRRASLVSHQSKSSNESSYHMKRMDTASPSITCSFLDENILESSSPGSGGVINKLDALKSNISWKSSSNHNNHDGLTRTQKTWLADVESILKDMYTAVKSHRIDQAAQHNIPVDNNNALDSNLNDSVHTTTGITLYRSRTLPKNDVGKSQSFRRRRGHSVINTLDTNLLLQTKTLPSLPANDLKQGLVMRKHVMESTDKRARHRQWQLCYLVMNETELIMYRPTHQSQKIQHHYDVGNHHSHKARRRRSMMLWNQSVCSLQDIVSQGGMEEWQADEEQAPLGKLEMNHAYASAIPPPGWNGQRPHVFRMETADGGLWLFESVDMFAIQAWVEAANATAARISKGPLTGAVCNIDYGWGAKWDNTTKEFTAENVPIWYPPTPCMINSTLDLNEQYYDLESQIKALNQQLNDHRELKLSLDKKFSASGNHHGLNSMQALTNWDRKLHFILHELIKLRCYKDSLQMRMNTIVQ